MEGTVNENNCTKGWPPISVVVVFICWNIDSSILNCIFSLLHSFFPCFLPFFPSFSSFLTFLFVGGVMKSVALILTCTPLYSGLIYVRVDSQYNLIVVHTYIFTCRTLHSPVLIPLPHTLALNTSFLPSLPSFLGPFFQPFLWSEIRSHILNRQVAIGVYMAEIRVFRKENKEGKGRREGRKIKKRKVKKEKKVKKKKRTQTRKQ